MKLRIFAEIATILAFLIAVLTFVKIEPNAIDKLPETFKNKADSDVKKIELLIEKDKYQGESKKLYRQYQAAISISNTYSKDVAISQFVECALRSNDYKIAIAAAKNMGNSYSKTNVLSSIADHALKSEDNAGYAIVAAELIPNSYTKDAVLSQIVSFYKRGSLDNRGNTSKELTPLDQYKEVYTFADASNYMGMSEKEARLFADKWMKERDYETFLFFKEVYMFADASNQMGMSKEDAKKFALDWIDNSYSKKDFQIFKDAYIFANSSSKMNMKSDQATEFALKKMKEAKSTDR